MENLTVGVRGTSVYVYCIDVRTRDANDTRGYVRRLSDPSGMSWSMTQSGSTPRQGQSECGEVNLSSRYPWIVREVRGNRWASVARCVIYVYILALCRNTSKGAAAPPFTGRKYDPASHVPAERENAEPKKCPMKRETCRSIKATWGRERRTILKKLTMWRIEK